jgi:hypothetical protein
VTWIVVSSSRVPASHDRQSRPSRRSEPYSPGVVPDGPYDFLVSGGCEDDQDSYPGAELEARESCLHDPHTLFTVTWMSISVSQWAPASPV